MKAERLCWRAAYLSASAGLFIFDQATKAWAVRALRYGDVRTIIPGLLAVVYAENPGIAFGQLQDGGQIGRWLLVALAIVAGVAVLAYFFRASREDDRVLGACALLVAGIAGNLTDRARLGYVVDFVLVHLGSYQWPTFNVADASICAGALLLASDLFFRSQSKQR